MTAPIRTLLVVLAIIAFVLSAIAAQTGDDIILNAITWLGIGGAFFAGAHLP